ncbi:MAG TPA: hypothetical protein EYH07_12860, partial [Kiloniellaceae bacterium]|nr:hypothetical protein [Kiloniellaceae bacterium]
MRRLSRLRGPLGRLARRLGPAGALGGAALSSRAFGPGAFGPGAFGPGAFGRGAVGRGFRRVAARRRFDGQGLTLGEVLGLLAVALEAGQHVVHFALVQDVRLAHLARDPILLRQGLHLACQPQGLVEILCEADH